MEVIFIITTIVGVILLQTYHVLQIRTLKIRELYQRRFSIQSELIMGKARLSGEDQELLSFLIGTIDKDETVSILLSALSQILQDRFKGKPPNNNPFSQDLSNLVVYWTYAISYRKLFRGFLIRYFMHTLHDPKAKALWQKKIRERAHSTYATPSGFAHAA